MYDNSLNFMIKYDDNVATQVISWVTIICLVNQSANILYKFQYTKYLSYQQQGFSILTHFPLVLHICVSELGQ